MKRDKQKRPGKTKGPGIRQNDILKKYGAPWPEKILRLDDLQKEFYLMEGDK